jgi:hypothetical protein
VAASAEHDGCLVQKTARDADRPLLGVATEPDQIFVVKPMVLSPEKPESEGDLEGGARGQACFDREVGAHPPLQTAHGNAGTRELGCDRQDESTPTRGGSLTRRQIEIVESLRGEMRVITTARDLERDTSIDRHWQGEASGVIGVLTDQVDAPRPEIRWHTRTLTTCPPPHLTPTVGPCGGTGPRGRSRPSGRHVETALCVPRFGGVGLFE